MDSRSDFDPFADSALRGRVPRALWHTLGLIVATMLAYLIWRGYQNPDLIIDLAAMRLC